jgi:hypothetical protein
MCIHFEGDSTVEKRKRLPRSVSIADLRTLCASLFKVAPINLHLSLRVSKVGGVAQVPQVLACVLVLFSSLSYTVQSPVAFPVCVCVCVCVCV